MSITPASTRPNRRLRTAALAAFTVFALVGAACGSDDGESTAEASPTTGDDALQVAYLPCGMVNDRSWSQAGHEGVMEAQEELGLEVSVSESLSPAEVEDAMRDYARQGYDVVLGHCGSFVDATIAVAPEFPDTWFEAAGVPEAPGPNTFAYDPLQEQGSFLAGVLAGSMTETDTVGMIVAYDFPAFNRQAEAFALGARYANPDVEARSTYIETFEDAARAKEAAIGQIDQGADVLFVATDQAAVGVFEATGERDVFAIAQYADQQELAPDTIVTSVLYRQGQTLTEILGSIQDGTIEEGAAFAPGLDEGVGDLADFGTFEDEIPDEVKSCLDELASAIAAGEFEVPGVDVLGQEGAGTDYDVDSLGSVPACEEAL